MMIWSLAVQFPRQAALHPRSGERNLSSGPAERIERNSGCQRACHVGWHAPLSRWVREVPQLFLCHLGKGASCWLLGVSQRKRGIEDVGVKRNGNAA